MKDKTYNCKDCDKECRVKAYTPELVELGLCSQCYTKRMMIIEKINNVKLGEKILLKQYGHILDYVYFDQTPLSTLYFEERGLYSWVAQTDGWRSVFPMKNTTYVKFFKTLKGAKRNFIKLYIERQ